MLEISNFWATGQDSLPISVVSRKSLQEGVGNVYIWQYQLSKIKEGDFFDKREVTGGKILGSNPAGYHFVLKDLSPVNFFREVMNVELKMSTAGKIVGKIRSTLRSVLGLFNVMILKIV